MRFEAPFDSLAIMRTNAHEKFAGEPPDDFLFALIGGAQPAAHHASHMVIDADKNHAHALAGSGHSGSNAACGCAIDHDIELPCFGPRARYRQHQHGKESQGRRTHVSSPPREADHSATRAKRTFTGQFFQDFRPRSHRQRFPAGAVRKSPPWRGALLPDTGSTPVANALLEYF